MADQEVSNIIQAMIANANSAQASRNAAQQKIRDAEEARANQARESYLGDTLKHVQDQADAQHNLEQQRIDLQSQTLQNLRAQQHLEAKRQMRTDVATGLQPIINNPPGSTEAPNGDTYGVQQPTNSTQVGDSSDFVPNTQLQTPQDLVKQAEAMAQAKAQGEYEGNKKLYATQMNQSKEQIQAAKDTAAQNRADSLNQTRLMIAALHGGVVGGVDPDTNLNNYNSILNGQRSYTSLTKQEKMAVDVIAAHNNTSLPTNQPQYSKLLQATDGIQSLIGQYRDLATQYSRDAPNSNIVSTVTGSSTVPFTDLKSKSDALKSQAGSLATFFDQQNRKSDAEILRQFNGLFDPRATIQQNLDKINSHVQTLQQGIKGAFAGIAPEDVRRVMQSRGSSDLMPSTSISPFTQGTSGQPIQQTQQTQPSNIKDPMGVR